MKRVNYIATPLDTAPFPKGTLYVRNGGLWISTASADFAPSSTELDTTKWTNVQPEKGNGRETIFASVLERLDALEKTNP